MDGNTEPLIAVLGRPIAGNPSQFAIERGLESLDLEFRVTSFDVAPEDVGAALSGLQVLGFHGVLIDSALGFAATEWCKLNSPRPDDSENEASSEFGAPTDCLFRDSESKERNTKFTQHHSLHQWLSETIKNHFQSRGQELNHLLWVGARDESFPAEVVSESQMELSTRTPGSDSVQQANLIILAEGPKRQVELAPTDWPDDDGTTLVIDLTPGHPEIQRIAALGYTVINDQSRLGGVIQQCINRWTEQHVAGSIIQEAIEEYLSV